MHPTTSASTTLNTPLRYKANRTCDFGDVCGTTVSTISSSHGCLSIIRPMILSKINHFVNLMRSSFAYMTSLGLNRQFLLTWQIAPFTSISSMHAVFLSVHASCTRLKILAIASIVLLYFLDRIWPSWGIWFISHYLANISVTNLSQMLLRQLKRRITRK